MQDAAFKTIDPPVPALTGRHDAELGDHAYDFYRCQRCQRLITQPEMRRAMRATKLLRVCPCGALKFSPTNPLWYEYLLPRVLVFAWFRARALRLSGIVANLKAGGVA